MQGVVFTGDGELRGGKGWVMAGGFGHPRLQATGRSWSVMNLSFGSWSHRGDLRRCHPEQMGRGDIIGVFPSSCLSFYQCLPLAPWSGGS